MELRQLRYFVRVVDLGSFTSAALDLELVQSTLSQQIGKLESELSAVLLRRRGTGVQPTEAGLAFYRHAKLALRHAEDAAEGARQKRLSGRFSLGLSPTTASVLGLPLLKAMHQQYPGVRLHLVETLSGHLSDMLHTRQIDLAVLFHPNPAARWSVLPLCEEKLILIAKSGTHLPAKLSLARLAGLPLILPTGFHGLRRMLDAAFVSAGMAPTIMAEIDSLPVLMDAVAAGLAATIQPWAAVARYGDADKRFALRDVAGLDVRRTNSLCALPDDELSPAAAAGSLMVRACVRDLIGAGKWQSAIPICELSATTERRSVTSREAVGLLAKSR